jgi:hypothetical protein
MPRGAESFNKHKAAVEQRKAEAQAQFGPKADFFGIEGGQFAAVRFLEQGTDIAWASMHRVPVATSQYPQDVVCLDQGDDGTPCPFCQSEHKGIRARSTKGFYNVIWRGNTAFQAVNQQILANNAQLIAAGQPPQATYTLAPVYKRNEWNSPEKVNGQKIILSYQDDVFLWKCSKTVHDDLVAKDPTYGGLMSRDFVVRRQGSTKEDTKYFIDPADVNSGAVPMSAEDQALALPREQGGRKYDLEPFITPMTLEQAVALMAGIPSNGLPPDGGVVAPPGTFPRGGVMPPAPGLPPAPVPGPMTPQVGVPDPNAPTPFQHPAPASAVPPPPAGVTGQFQQ